MKQIVGLLALISSVGLVQAAETPSLFNNNIIGVQLSDEVLGAQRGKFVAANARSHYFGIEFITTIPGANNTMITNSMQVNVNFNQKQPVKINTYSSAGSATSNNASTAGANNILPNGSGVVQAAQIAGNGNAGINDFMFIPGQMKMQGQTLKQGHYQLNLPEGTVRYDVNSSGLGMSYISQNGNVNSTQRLRNNQGNKGFVQQFRITDNNKLLSNQTKFYIGDKMAAYTDLADTLRQQLPTGIR
ncbi:hypothetical protein [Oceanisphaera pacifica]|uniref:Uncharacterized protein n=1 Tax=Oceanisphaera pacifica TaxID=2818389 RepID=A0ABS3NF62_9GAMM|nr:hypothetical protein [Oceanisphaera pacifica]MBO1519219.1 hypothetical protein [Oceanisphaera pacifica]